MEAEAPKVVYKFRDWQNANHRNILYHNEIYLASPADFNDPFDCRIISDFSLVDTREKKIEYLRTLQQVNPKNDINQGLKNLEDIIANPENYERGHFEYDDKHLAIFCTCLKWDVIPLWSHYANFHTGFCVGFYLEKLFTALPFCKMGNVNYHDYPSIDPRDRIDPNKYIVTSFKQTHYKAEEWEYEKEFRLTRKIENDLTMQDRLIHLSDDCIGEITLGLNFPTIDIPKVEELASGKKWPLFKAKKIPMKFGLDRERIQ